MNRWKRTIAVCLIAVLGIVSFTGCGKEETETASAPKRTELKSSVTMAVACGEAFSLVGKLSGDIKVEKVKTHQDVIKNIKDGKCDLAVLTPIEAGRLYNEKKNIKVVTTLSLADWKIAMKDYEGQVEDEDDMRQVSGRYMVGVKDDPNGDQLNDNGSEETVGTDGTDGEKPTYTVNESGVMVDQYGNPVAVDEPEEVVELKEMSEEVFQTLMAKENLGFFDGQIDWKDISEVSDYLNGYKSIVIANENNVKKATAGIDNFTELYSLADMWNKEFDNEIPGYVLVATDKFLDKRNYEVEGVLDIIADTLKDNQENSDLKLVAYNVSNRGVIMVREFLDNVAKYNSDAIDGEKVGKGFYWSGK